MLVGSPVGRQPWPRVVLHALFDALVHERDVTEPLGRSAPYTPHQLPVLAYVVLVAARVAGAYGREFAVRLDLGGQARFGPDVEWVEREDYDVSIGRAAGFYAAIRRYWPALPDGALAPGYAGIRPKISGPGEPAADFVVAGPETHGVPGLVNLFGIESPGLTSSMALAEHVAGVVNEGR